MLYRGRGVSREGFKMIILFSWGWKGGVFKIGLNVLPPKFFMMRKDDWWLEECYGPGLRTSYHS